MPKTYDFSGYVTRNNIRCSDGRTIRRNAFIDNDGATVPLVFQHNHKGMDNVLGHVLLENRDDGVFGYGSFNDTAEGQRARALVQHGDLTQLSIYANGLKQTSSGDVMHGNIREVSLVYAGANPGAYIQTLEVRHADDPEFDEEFDAEIFTGLDLKLRHADDEEDDEDEKGHTVKDVFDTFTEEQKHVVYYMIDEALKEGKSDGKISHADSEEDEEEDSDDKTVKEVFDELTEEQKQVVYYMIGEAVKKAKGEEDDEVEHADDAPDKEEMKAIFDELTEEQKQVVYYMIGEAMKNANADEEDEEISHADEEDNDMAKNDDRTVKDVFDELTEEQKQVVYFMIGEALKNANGGSDDTAEHAYYDYDEEDYLMHQNIFENAAQEEFLAHADAFFDETEDIFRDAKRMGSLKEAVLEHAASNNITNIDYLFPDAKALSDIPEFININQDFVKEFMDRVHKSPFARIKTVFADITEAEARAKGYVKGNQKADQVFSLLKRVTTPTTVYKHQSLDRDDYVDITDFDVIAWLKAEMRGKLDEELVRAFLVGDGRATSSADKINETNIRPIWTDDDLFTIKALITVSSTATDDEIATAVIRGIITARKNYRGTGNPIFFTSEDALTKMLLLTDSTGRDLYDTTEKLTTKLRVSKIVTSEVMENLTRTDDDGKTRTLYGIVVNPTDYNIGTDKNGAVNFFDDFDIDYNKMKYLIETRCSGALIKPYSAIAVEVTVNPS